MVMQWHFGFQQRDKLGPTDLAEVMQGKTLTLAGMHRRAALQVRQVNGTSANPANNFLANVVTFAYRNNISNLTTIHPATLTNVGGSQAHNNMMPYLVLNFCIALQGIFPSPT